MRFTPFDEVVEIISTQKKIFIHKLNLHSVTKYKLNSVDFQLHELNIKVIFSLCYESRHSSTVKFQLLFHKEP